jgi:hypothetical protein
MKRRWWYEDSCWKTQGTVDWKELNAWAAFYGKDFQTALNLATEGKIPMWFTFRYTVDVCTRARRIFNREVLKEANRIYEPMQRFINSIYRRAS